MLWKYKKNKEKKMEDEDSNRRFKVRGKTQKKKTLH